MELVLAIAIFAIGSIVAGNMIIDATTATRIDVDKAEAVQIAREGIEAVTSIRDSATFASTTDPTSFSVLSIASPKGLTAGAGGYGWTFSSSPFDVVDTKFNRSIYVTLTPASAPFNSTSYAVVTSTVSWNNARNATDTVSLSTILTNWRFARPAGM